TLVHHWRTRRARPLLRRRTVGRRNRTVGRLGRRRTLVATIRRTSVVPLALRRTRHAWPLAGAHGPGFGQALTVGAQADATALDARRLHQRPLRHRGGTAGLGEAGAGGGGRDTGHDGPLLRLGRRLADRSRHHGGGEDALAPRLHGPDHPRLNRGAARVLRRDANRVPAYG